MSTWKVIEGDCLEVMKSLDLGSVDAVVTDPPYGVKENYRSFEDTRENVSVLAKRLIPLLKQISPVILMTPGNGNQYLYPEPDWTLAWVERAGAGQNKWGFTCWQPILAYGKSPHRAANMGARPDVFFGTGEKSVSCGHPCPKPEGVVRWMVENSTTRTGATVLDPFCGSGTTGVACMMTGRNFIGIEIDPKYAAIARRRIAEAANTLWAPTEKPTPAPELFPEPAAR